MRNFKRLWVEYEDSKGDYYMIPLKNLNPEQLHFLINKFSAFKKCFLEDEKVWETEECFR